MSPLNFTEEYAEANGIRVFPILSADRHHLCTTEFVHYQLVVLTRGVGNTYAFKFSCVGKSVPGMVGQLPHRGGGVAFVLTVLDLQHSWGILCLLKEARFLLTFSNLKYELQAIVVDYLRQTDLLFCASFGGYLDSPGKRIKSWIDGYQKGQPDLIIYTPSADGKYKGLALELKRPISTGKISKEQVQWLERLEIECGYFCLASNDLVVIIEVLVKYIHGILT
jgi:hypothetical protein